MSKMQQAIFEKKLSISFQKLSNNKKEDNPLIKQPKAVNEIVNGWIKDFNNRKINKLEREYQKTREEANRLAHEVKLRTGIADNLLDIQRYKKELEKIKQDEDNHIDK